MPMKKYNNIKVILTNREAIYGKTDATEAEVKTIFLYLIRKDKAIAIKGENDHLFLIPTEKVMYVEYY